MEREGEEARPRPYPWVKLVVMLVAVSGAGAGLAVLGYHLGNRGRAGMTEEEQAITEARVAAYERATCAIEERTAELRLQQRQERIGADKKRWHHLEQLAQVCGLEPAQADEARELLQDLEAAGEKLDEAMRQAELELVDAKLAALERQVRMETAKTPGLSDKLGLTERTTCHVRRVIDGETIEIVDSGGIRTPVRPRDVDAPELDEPGASEAKAALEHKLLGKGVVVTLHGRGPLRFPHRGRGTNAT